MSLRNLTLICALLLAPPAGELLFSFFRWSGSLRCDPGTSPAIHGFAYSPLRTGSAPSCLSASSFSGLTTETLKLPFDPTPAMLLYWNGLGHTSLPALAGRRVILGQAYPATAYAYDLDERRVLWSHDFYPLRADGKKLTPVNSSAPVIDPAGHRLYGSFIEERYVGTKPTDSRLTQHYYSIRLDGGDAKLLEVDLSRFVLGPGTRATPDDIRKYLRCRAALAISSGPGAPELLSGCSIVRAFSYQGRNFVHHASSQSVPGIRGALIAIPLDRESGSFGAPRAFVPAQTGKAPGAGVDAGIWMSGGAPTVLPENRILLATGNGAYRPSEKLFGCAVLRLDGKSLQPDGGNSTQFSARGRAPEQASRDCHLGNLDPSSSAVATIEAGGRLFSAIGGKDGWLKSFPPLRLPGSEFFPDRELQLTDGYVFGQPVLFRSDRHHIVASLGGNGSKGLEWKGFSLGPDHSLRELWAIRDPHPRAYNSSAAGTYRSDGLAPLLLLPLASGPPERGLPSSLLAIDATNGRVLSETSFRGAVHFSMPTVVDELVLLPTAEHGIQLFRHRPSFPGFVRHQSWLGRLF